MLKKTVLTVFVLVIFTSIAIADSAILYPTDDADVWQDTPDVNRGAEQNFQVGCISTSDWRNVLIKFDLSAYAGATINNATIRLKVFSSYGAFPTTDILIARNNADWSELTITWNNKPASVGSYSITAPSVLDWWEIDVTGWIQDIVDGTDPNYGFQILQNNTNYAGFLMFTKESPVRPELVLDYEPVSLEHTTFGRIKSLFN